MTTCAYCGAAVDPLGQTTYRRIVGWERKAVASSRRGGSDIALREHQDEYAHGYCIERERSGISVSQESLL